MASTRGILSKFVVALQLVEINWGDWRRTIQRCGFSFMNGSPTCGPFW